MDEVPDLSDGLPGRVGTASVPTAGETSEKTSFSSDDGFEEWHDVTCRNYSRSEFRRDGDSPFSANIVLRPYGALGLTDGWSDGGAATLTRSPTEFRQDSRDHFTLFYVTKGEIGIEQEGRQARGKPGDFFIYDQARPIVLDFKPVYRAWMLGIPRPMLRGEDRRYTIVHGTGHRWIFQGRKARRKHCRSIGRL